MESAFKPSQLPPYNKDKQDYTLYQLNEEKAKRILEKGNRENLLTPMLCANFAAIIGGGLISLNAPFLSFRTLTLFGIPLGVFYFGYMPF